MSGPSLGEFGATLAAVGSKSDETRQHFVDAGPMLAKIGRFPNKLAPVRSKLVEFGSMSTDSRSTLVEFDCFRPPFGPTPPTFDQTQAKFGRTQAKFGRTWSNSVQVWHMSAQMLSTPGRNLPHSVEVIPNLNDLPEFIQFVRAQPNVGRSRPEFGQIPENSAGVGPIWAKTGLQSKKLHGPPSGGVN